MANHSLQTTATRNPDEKRTEVIECMERVHCMVSKIQQKIIHLESESTEI